MKIFVYLFILSSISGFAKTFKARVIDDITKKPITNAKIIIEKKDTIFTNEDGFFEFQSELDLVHLDAQKLSYKLAHYDISLKDIGDFFIIPLHPLNFHLHNIIVTGNRKHSVLDSFILSSYQLDNKDINSNLQVSFGESLQSLKGVDIRSMGSAPTRPIFRGLSNDRLKINTDGFLNIDLSASSPDHNVAIDPQSIKEAKILRGPKTLKFSSSSSAGIIDLVKDDIPLHKIDDYHLEVKNFYHSNNTGFMNYIESSVNVDDLFNIKGKASFINSNDIQTPVQSLTNTAINSKNFSFGFGRENKENEFGGVYEYYENNFGIPPGPLGMHPSGVNIEMFRHNFKFVYNYHFHNNNYIKDMSINYLYNYLFHEEFESTGIVGARYIIENNLLRLDFEGENIIYSDKTDFGINFSDNFFDAGAAVRTPEVRDFDFAIYFIQSYQGDKVDLDVAFRNENKFYNPIKDVSVPRDSEFLKRAFSTKTLSISNIYKDFENIKIGSILSYDERIPTLEELYSLGPHLASYSFDIGNQDLSIEQSVNSELFASHIFKVSKVNIENSINLYNYYFFNFITPRNTGEMDLIRTRLPIFENQGMKANLSGFEYQITASYDKFHFKNLVQYTHGINLDDNIPLPMIAPLKNILEFKYKTQQYDIAIITEFANTQNRIDKFETITENYTLFNIKSNYYFYLFGFQNQLVFNIRNIFNSTYRNHLSRIKDIMPEPGRNVSIGINNYF
jgi:iron complex outermembrane receptor protein